jgi:hypothetical protein
MEYHVGDMVEAAGITARIISLYRDGRTVLVELEPDERGPRVMTCPIRLLKKIAPDVFEQKSAS